MRIDAHQHFWQLARGDYGWLTSDLKPLHQDFLPKQLAPHLAQCDIAGSILVQAAPTLAETHFMLALAERTSFIKGVIGWVDMVAPDVCNRLAELKQQPYFKGIRPMIQDIADVDWMLHHDLAAAFEQLIALDLTFEALVKPIHLPNLLKLLQRHKDLRVLINHAAKPNIVHGQFDQWAQDVQALAQHTQAYCKISGLLTEAPVGTGLTEIIPYLDHLLTCFGSERLIWGSDWPVINLVSDYQTWYDMTKRYLEHLSLSEQQQILGENAKQVYQLCASALT